MLLLVTLSQQMPKEVGDVFSCDPFSGDDPSINADSSDANLSDVPNVD